MPIRKVKGGWKIDNTSGISRTKKAAKRRLRAIKYRQSKKRISRKGRKKRQEKQMDIAEILGTTTPATTGTATASTVELADYVMLHNSGSTLREVVIQTEASGTSIGNVYLSSGERIIIKKDPSHVIFAAHAEVKLTKVNPRVI